MITRTSERGTAVYSDCESQPTGEPMHELTNLICRAHETARSKGWWDGNPERTFGDQIALMHSELSEALEEFRNGHALDEIYTSEGNKTEGVAAEFADVLIRIFDTCGRYGIPLATALEQKMAFNETRPRRHGGKVL